MFRNIIAWMIKNYPDRVDWIEISKNPNLTPVLIEKYLEKLDFNNLSQNLSLTPELIEKYRTRWHWEKLSENPALLPKNMELIQIRKYFQLDLINWEHLGLNPGLTPEIIREYLHIFQNYESIQVNPGFDLELIKICFPVISKNKIWANPNLTPEFLETNLDKINWDYLSLNNNISGYSEIIDKNPNKLDWKKISQNPGLTPEFIDKYFHKMIKHDLILNPGLTPELIEKYTGFINWELILANPNISLGILYRIISEIGIENIDFNILSINENLNPEFIEIFRDKLNWKFLSGNYFNFSKHVIKIKTKKIMTILKIELIQEIVRRKKKNFRNHYPE